MGTIQLKGKFTSFIQVHLLQARNTGDPETGGPITPLHLQLGRATVEVPKMRFEEAPRLTQRLQFIEEAKRQFWKKWMQQVFSGRMLNHK